MQEIVKLEQIKRKHYTIIYIICDFSVNAGKVNNRLFYKLKEKTFIKIFLMLESW